MSTSARIVRGTGDALPFAPLQFPEHSAAALRPSRPPAKDGAVAEHKAAEPPDVAAHQVLAAARAQAEALINEANAQAKAVETQAYEQGYAAGQTAALAAIEERLEETKAAYQDSIVRLVRMREELLGQCEQEIVRLVLEVAKKVVQREVSIDREVVLALIKVALSRVSSNTPVTVRVHRDDYQFLETRRHEFLSGENGVVNLVQDRSISRGGCLIETEFGQVDARLEQQFKEIERGFFSEV